MFEDYHKDLDENTDYNLAVERLMGHRTIAGKGSYGICFNGAEGQVLKLHPSKDQGYHTFIKWVQTLSTQIFVPHFPRILYCDEKGDCLTIIMERLYHHQQLSELETKEAIPLITPSKVSSISEALEQAKNRFTYMLQLKRKTAYMFHKNWADFRVSPSLENAFSAIFDNVYEAGFACDLHDENIMFRRDIDCHVWPVIIDPFT